jgi:hypothetical protein
MKTTPTPDPAADSPGEGMRCDFCSRVVPSVHRVVLDGEYERLRTKHTARYACQDCSRHKERQRLETEAG